MHLTLFADEKIPEKFMSYFGGLHYRKKGTAPASGIVPDANQAQNLAVIHTPLLG